MDLIVAEYLLETPFPVEEVAAMMAGEQSSGTFVRVAGETDELRARAAAQVLSVEVLGQVDSPSLTSAYVERKGKAGPFTRARVRIAFPPGNIGRNLPTLAATVSGNLYDIGEITGLKLLSVELPADYRARYPMPAQGIAGTRATLGVTDRPLFGTIIKPNVGMTSEDIAALVDRLCAAGVDFIKDDEVCANPDVAPLATRVPAVMAVLRKWQDKGRNVMMAFNITDETDAMRRHADLVAAEGGTCVMASLNWCGLSGMETLRAATPLAIHGHRNGFGAMSRHPLLGMGFPAYQSLYRLAGVDHMHVHGIGGKFVDHADEVTEAARACLAPLTDGADDRVMPAFSSGQWAGTMPSAYEAAQGPDFMFMCGGGILAHPDGPAQGIASLREAWEALSAGEDLEQAAQSRPALAAAFRFFGAR
ncbi:ribulose-bisphosphate carboxylase large subunit family protein [Mameliella sp. AT18]|uniref:ribulose-bisphosphate carboxylase large subunit family protein n=1 Tax=Mameliella sp. AT18 TaxID=3028385 RepID=UPI0008412236|nr:ribulose-bisphosphate carboxylase large subunit family protein [Mameliella sp. AT18]MDD9732238.1 ribulose-bisphosphate carboxylase large subunit family protein [Mameliella sp. AT18]ODM48997.1 ribulose 1,5-bisphosphate carboxylase [Ruegeria sp. PBVC088]